MSETFFSRTKIMDEEEKTEEQKNMIFEKCPKCGRPMVGVMSGETSSTIISWRCDYCEGTTDFDFFIKCLSTGYREFCLNQKMHEEIKVELYHKFKRQWDTILVALEMDYKLWLAKILENPHECLKGYKFPEEYQIIIDRITNWRNDFLAHFNSNTLKSWENFREKNILDNDSIGKLFNKIIEIADYYNTGYNPSLNLKEYFYEQKEEILSECNKWLDNFKA